MLCSALSNPVHRAAHQEAYGQNDHPVFLQEAALILGRLPDLSCGWIHHRAWPSRARLCPLPLAFGACMAITLLRFMVEGC